MPEVASKAFGVENLIEARTAINKNPAGQFVQWDLSAEALRYIYETVEPGSRTLETGCGKSTVVFAMLKCRHTYVDPCTGIVDRLAKFCRDNGVQIDTLLGYENPSEDQLPFMEQSFDFFLLDGRHSFPTPFVDFFYGGEMLKVGGRLMLDDIDIWSVRMVHQFLSHDQANWKLVATPTIRQVIYEKLGDDTFTNHWKDQPFAEQVTRV